MIVLEVKIEIIKVYEKSNVISIALILTKDFKMDEIIVMEVRKLNYEKGKVYY